MLNKQFQKTEYAIFIAYCKFRDYPTTKRIAKHAKISRSTLYRHHRSTQKILHDYEELIIAAFSNIAKQLIDKQATEKNLFLHTLVFIVNHKEVFQALFSDGRKEVIKSMLGTLKPALIKRWNTTGGIDKVYNVYENEILGIIESWSKHQFSKSQLEKVLNDIINLTNTAPTRLPSIIGEKPL